MTDRLDSWKDIAAYLGREVRTVQRWEAERSLPVHRLPGGDRPRVYALKAELDTWLRTSAVEQADLPSVAVLPFVNLSADPENAYFSDGLAEDVITALTRVPGLRVTARTSSFAYRDRNLDVRRIGADLSARALLEGSVRREGNRIRVSAQLVSAEDGYHLWSESYDRQLGDVFGIQEEVARAIAHELKVRIGPAPLVGRPTADLEAYSLWLQGRSLGAEWTADKIAEASACYRAALARDPKFPLPYLSIADSLFYAAWFGLALPPEAFPQALQFVQQALDLDPSLGEAHALRGCLLAVLNFDWDSAEREFERARELSPGSSTILYRHAWVILAPKRRYAEALAEMELAVRQDPLSPLMHGTLGMVLLEARDYARAEKACRVALELAPGFWWSHFFLSCALLLQNKGDEALTHCRQAWTRLGPSTLAAADQCFTYGLLGRPDDALRAYAAFERTAQQEPVPALAHAWAYLGLGDDRAYEWLDKAIDGRDPAVTHLPGMPIYDELRADPRFNRLLTKMNLA